MTDIISENAVWSRKQILNFHCHSSLVIPFCHYFNKVLILVPSVEKGKVREKNVNIKVKIAEFVLDTYSSF